MSDQPPKKRLKLSVRPPISRSIESNHSNHSNESAQSDTIVVSTRPRRSVTLNKRYSAQAPDDGEVNDGNTTSDLSSAPSTPSVEEEPSPPTSKPPKSAKLDYGAMFLATYLEGGLEDAGEEEGTAAVTDEVASEPPAVKSPVARGARPSVRTDTGIVAASTVPSASHGSSSGPTPAAAAVRSASAQLPHGRNGGSTNALRPPSAQPHHRPVNHSWHQSSVPPRYQAPQFRKLYEPAAVEFPKDPATFASMSEMVKKVKILQKALVRSRGIVPPSSSSDSGDDEEKQNPLDDRDPLNPFLALFEDNESDTSDEVVHPSVGEPDEALVHGVNFIMNSLREHASRRIEMGYTNATRYHFQLLQEWDAKRRASSSRPKKITEEYPPPPPPPPPPIRLDAAGLYDLTGYPEAAAIAAFAEVIKSGALQLNTLVPRRLSRALRKLYKQLDQLINANPPQQDWRMFSYHAQIQAQAELVQNIKVQQMQAQQLMAQSQMDNERRIMQNMGLMHNHVASPNNMQRPVAGLSPKEQEEWQRRVEIERKRNSQHARAQPYLHQQHLHPMQFRPLESPTGPGNSMSMSAGAPVPASGPQYVSPYNSNGPHPFLQRPHINQANPSAMQALAQRHLGMGWHPAHVGPVPQNAHGPNASSYRPNVPSNLNRGDGTAPQAAVKAPSLPPNSPSDPITISSSPVRKGNGDGSKRMSAADAGLLGALGIMSGGKSNAPSAAAANAHPASRSDRQSNQVNGWRRSSGVSTSEPAMTPSEKKRGKRKEAEVIEID